ncbi:MAG: NAD(P)/FAD-dependent oxidoreductase [Bryobacteraceae bacterium]|nr:FAD/NAD(P)-binding oxidoreductase [Bryobacterales bacterium]NUM99749.1 NAD(P)/FAD-dependent oxidoreductase [Bryobacteraceae bacterium]
MASASAAGYYLLTPHGPRSDAKASVLVAGGGAAGISITSRLRRALPNARITIVDPATEHYYQPGFTLIACGEFAPADVVRPQSSLIPQGVRWVQDAVTALDPDRKRLETSRNGTLSYDFLVLCPGLQMNFSAIEGLRREDLGRGNVHCIYDFAGAHKCWGAIQRLAETGGRAYFTDTWTKHKCGGAPKKINMLAEDYCRRAGVRDRVDIQLFTAADHIYDVPAFARRLEQIYAERKIPVTMEHRVKKVDVAARRVTFEDRRATSPVMVTYEFDFLHIVPPMSAPDFVKASPISVNPATGQHEDWVPADPATLRHPRYADVYVAGDVAGIPTSKTAAAVRMQAPVLAANLTATIDGRTPPARYDGYTACPFTTEYGKVLMAEFGYDKKPAPTIPFLDPAHEHRTGWILKRYVLKPMYFELMLRGLV